MAETTKPEVNEKLHLAAREEASAFFWNVPYLRNPFFTGREDFLAQLHEALMLRVSPVALSQPQAISGLGGIGKTQVAIEYAYRYREEYSAVLWVRADSYETLVSDYQLVATLLKLPESNEQEQSMMVQAVKRWFDTHENWLLILDNADNLQVIEEFLPATGKGYVLLTTRVYSTGTIAQRIELEKMSDEEALIFLLRRIKSLKGNASLESVSENVREQAQSLVKVLDGLPLALDQAAAYIERTGCSLADYLKFYQTRRQRLLRMRGDDAAGHPEPVATTWSLSFEKVQQANPAAAELLRLCAFLHPDEIPQAMIMAGAAELGPALQSLTEDEMELNEAIGELHRYSLIKRDPERKLLNIHRLVQAVIRDAMTQEAERQWAERVVKMMGTIFPEGTEFETWATCQEYLPHAQVCNELIVQENMKTLEAIQLLNHTGAYLGTRGRYKEAEPMLRKALALTEEVFGPEHELIASIINNLGINYWVSGQYDRTVSLLQRALAVQEKALGPRHEKVAETLNNLGVLYNAQGKQLEAIPLYERALAIWEETKHDDPVVAYTINNLAVVYDDLGRYKEAEELYKRALDIRQRLQGKEHPEVGTILNNLAVLYTNLGRYKEAVQLHEQSLVIVEKTMGKDHPRRGSSLDNLARNYQDLGWYDKAEATFKEALALRRRILGQNHASVAMSLCGLGSLYRRQGKYEEAEPLLQESLAIREKALGPDHYQLALSLYGLAMLRSDQDRYEEAETLFQRALSIREQTFGADHPDVAQVLDGLAVCYYKQGKYALAEPLFQRAIAIREQKLGTDHPGLAETLENYAGLLRITGQAEAEALEQRAQAIRAKQA